MVFRAMTAKEINSEIDINKTCYIYNINEKGVKERIVKARKCIEILQGKRLDGKWLNINFLELDLERKVWS